jgi:hypothetical protein
MRYRKCAPYYPLPVAFDTLGSAPSAVRPVRRGSSTGRENSVRDLYEKLNDGPLCDVPMDTSTVQFLGRSRSRPLACVDFEAGENWAAVMDDIDGIDGGVIFGTDLPPLA